MAYDPAFAYELVVIMQDGMKRMYENRESVFYYVTAMNENYVQPAMPEGAEEGIRKGIYLYQKGSRKKTRVQLLGAGTILREVIAAAQLLNDDFGIAADVWSVTSFNELRKEGVDVERWNMLHPDKKAKVSYVEKTLSGTKGPIVAATDYMRSYADQIRPYLGDKHYAVLGTDGYGRSDMRSQLRKFFEVNSFYVAVAALKALADEGEIEAKVVADAIKKYGIDPEKPNPVSV